MKIIMTIILIILALFAFSVATRMSIDSYYGIMKLDGPPYIIFTAFIGLSCLVVAYIL